MGSAEVHMLLVSLEMVMHPCFISHADEIGVFHKYHRHSQNAGLTVSAKNGEPWVLPGDDYLQYFPHEHD